MNSVLEKTTSKTTQIGALFQAWFNLLVRPKRFFTGIAAGEIKTWLFPMILLTGACTFYSIGQGTAIDRLNQGRTTGLSIFSTILFNLSVLWICWFWMSGILNSFLILAGIRFPKSQPRLIIAWAFSPFVIRSLVRLAYTLVTGLPILTPGLSGFLGQSTGFIPVFVSQLFAQIDFYFLWQSILLWIGLKSLPAIRPLQRKLGFLMVIVNQVILFGLIKTIAILLQRL